MPDTNTELLHTPLHDLHLNLGGKMVGFAGYSMPVQYAHGIVFEHNHTRSRAGLFDVSHMGQLFLIGPDHKHTASKLETLVPGDIRALKPGRTRYTQFTNPNGGVIDDLMVTRMESEDDDGTLYLVINASRKKQDLEVLAGIAGSETKIELLDDRALLALQGPASENVLSSFCEGVEDFSFMSSHSASIAGLECLVSRSGYTGEDGFEISVPAENASELAQALLTHDAVMACGLGARDSLRLEAGLCLYGNDLDETTSPVEAGLLWSISKRRRQDGGFPGAVRIQAEITAGASRVRVGIKPDGRAPARAGVEIADLDGETVGVISSGGFGPTVGGPIAMGYVPREFSTVGTKLNVMVRGKALPATVVALPFIPNNFKR